MDANMRTIWVNRALNLVAFCGVLVSALMAAAAESADIAEQLIKAGVVPAKWAGVAAIIAIFGHVAAKYSKTPSQTIAAAVPPAKGPPPVGALVLFLAVAALSCAHQQTITDGLEGIALDCGKEVEPAILPAIESVAAQPSKEAALAQAEILAEKVGWCVVSKGAASVLNDLITRHAASDERTMNKATNLQELLNRHPVP